MRDFDEKPYSVDEQRVAQFFFDKGTGGGDDPIAALMASHEYLLEERKRLRNLLREPLSSAELKLVDKNCAWEPFKHAWNAIIKARLEKISDR